MAPTRMKLRVRRRDNPAAGAAAGGGQSEGERSRESSGRSNRRKTTAAAAAAASSSPPPSSSSSASARAVMAAEEASPDSKCPICLDRFNNLAYLDRCLHRFCFPCIQEWSHNKAECPLCKQPFASILHSVRAEDDFKEYTLRPPPPNSSVAATVAMVAAMASAARSDHQMRLMLRRHRGPDGEETTTRRRQRERGGRGRRAGVWEWYLDSPPVALPPLPHAAAVSPVVAEDSEEGEELEEQRVRGGAELAERGVIFEGLTGLGGGVVPVGPNDRASRRLMTRLVARQRLQREGGTVRRLRERETVAFRRALYRSGIRVRGVAGMNSNEQQRDITADSFRRSPTHLNRLRPWLRRELTVLYGAHGSLVDIVQRIIMARLARHGLEDTPTIEEELRPFLLARTDHFLHELVSFARSPLSLESYDLQAVYEPPAAAMELDGTSSSTDSSSVIAISEGEGEEGLPEGHSEERLVGRQGTAHDDVIQSGSCLSLSAWDDETPGPSYSSAEPSCSLAAPAFSPAPQETGGEEAAGEKREEEEECLIVGYKKPMAERTPELVQLSSDTEEEEEEEEKKKEENIAEKPPPLPATTPPLSYLPTIPPSTSAAFSREQAEEKDSEQRSCARSWSVSSGRNSVCTLSPATPGEGERRRWRDRKSCGEAAREKRRKKKRRRRGRERSGERLRRSGTLCNPNRSIYPALMRQRSPSPFHSSVDSGSPLPPSPPDSSWEYPCSQLSPLASSVSSHSFSSSPQPSSPTAPAPSLSPHRGEKPGGKRKYKSRHLDSNAKDPTWRPSSSRRHGRRSERAEKERRRRSRDRGRRRERQKRDGESRRSRDERSPSVEIIYEGTITANDTQSPARKRRRKRHRNTQHSSSPVIITLDSDSSHDNVNKHDISSSSSPISSQQTVDFSDLPALPLVHSAGVGGALNAEIGELPVNILDRGSDGSETETAGPIAIDNSDVDVEESGSLPGTDDDKGPMRTAERKPAANQRGGGAVDGSAQPVAKRDAEVSDCRLLATITNDLQGIAVPKCDADVNAEPSRSWRFQNLASPDEQQSDDIRDKNRGFNSRTCRTSFPLPPPHGQLKEVGAEVKDVPPLLKRASPVRSYNRNTPPPLKHKDAGSPHLAPGSPVGLHSPHAAAGAGADSAHIDLHTNSPNDSCLDADLLKDNSPIPPISTLKRHFMSAMALRGELALTSSVSANDRPSSCKIAPIDSQSTASFELREATLGIHSTSHKPPIDSHSAAPSKLGALSVSMHSSSRKSPIDSHFSFGSENSSTSADCVSNMDISSFLSSKFNSGRDSTKETSSFAHRSSPPINLRPVNSLSPIDFHLAKTGWFKEKPAHTDSTSRRKTLSPNSSRAATVDLHPSTSVSAEGAGGYNFSGVNRNDTSPPVFVSSTVDSHSSSQRESLPPCRVSSVPTAPSDRSSPIDVHPRSPKISLDHSSSATSDELMDINRRERLPISHPPPIEWHHTNPVLPADVHSPLSVSTLMDKNLNHTASATFQTSHKKCSSQSKPTVDSHAKLLRLTDSHLKPCNHFDPRCDPQLPIDACSKPTLPIDSQPESQPPPIDSHPKKPWRDFQPPTDNHTTSSPRSVHHQWSSDSSVDAHSDSQSPVDERSAGGVWNTHTHSAT
ncbi:serine/arginine repetitive matrix protein 2-like isoform X2 [Plectropomus leopardus]|uniref:serine/arginine repetitive matrix protein 2-like isoform X2 n=1 Tax=Plectropomus leopardus TaxID=160734 RepID=UPI001C4CE491|nr:serine/arginine repetitive matrix protein 2-like isoform X2 [Plectropomus leopardus]